VALSNVTDAMVILLQREERPARSVVNAYLRQMPQVFLLSHFLLVL